MLTSGKVFLEGSTFEVGFILIWIDEFLPPDWSIDLGITMGFGGCTWFDWALEKLLQAFNSLTLIWCLSGVGLE